MKIALWFTPETISDNHKKALNKRGIIVVQGNLQNIASLYEGTGYVGNLTPFRFLFLQSFNYDYIILELLTASSSLSTIKSIIALNYLAVGCKFMVKTKNKFKLCK